jgi:hypothetical protein
VGEDALMSIAFVAGGVAGFLGGMSFAIRQWLAAPALDDPIATGVRKQIKTVRDNRRLWCADSNLQCTSYAKVVTVDGEFEVIVRQPVADTEEVRP